MGMGLKVILIGFVALAGLLLLGRWMKRGGFRAFFLSALQGLAAAFAVNLLGTITSVDLPINRWTMGTAFTVGLPGVVGMIILDTVTRS